MLKPFLAKWPFLFKLRLLWVLVLGFLILILLYFKIVPFGHITYSRTWPNTWHSGQGFIGSFKPKIRLDLSEIKSPKIISEPIYFSVFTPRKFSTATLTIKYRDQLSTTTPIIELGILKDKLTEAYTLKPLQNNILDYWSSRWLHLGNSNSPLILEANPTYHSALKFLKDLKAGNLKNCPRGPLNCVAAYNYPLKIKYSLATSSPLVPLFITQPLRGAQQFYLYLNNKPWRLSIDFAYLHLDPKPDPVTVNIWRGDKIIITKSIPAGQTVAKKGSIINNKNLTFSGLAPQPGVYKVEIKIDNDVVIKSIESSSDKLAFIHRIWPVSGLGNLTLFTDAQHLRAQTSNPASLGKIIFDQRSFNLNKIDQPFNYLSAAKISVIKLKKDDIILADDGVFAFTAAGLFNPELKPVNRYFLPNNKLKYIVANYKSPVSDQGWKTASAQFNLIGAYRHAGRYTFLISIPGLGEQTRTKHYLAIKEITIDLKGKTLWQRIWSR